MPTSWPVVHALFLCVPAYVPAAGFTHGLSLVQGSPEDDAQHLQRASTSFPIVHSNRDD